MPADRPRAWLLAALLMLGCGSPHPAVTASSGAHPAAVAAPATGSPSESNAKRRWFVPYFAPLDLGSTFSPDGKLALGGTDLQDRVFVVNTRLAMPVLGIPRATRWENARFSPDGRLVATIRQDFRTGALVVAELDGARRVSTFPFPEGPGTGQVWAVLGWFPDSRRVVVDLGDSTVVQYDVVKQQITGKPLTAHSPRALAASAPLLVYTVPNRGGIRIVDLESGKVLFERTGTFGKNFAWHSKLPRLAAQGPGYTLVWTPERAPVELPLAGDPAWDARGERVALVDTSKTGCSACLQQFGPDGVFDATTGRELQSEGFSPDAPRLGAFLDHLQDRTTGEVSRVRAPVLEPTPLKTTAWQGDGSLLLDSARWAARVDLASGRVVEWSAKAPGDDYANFELVTTCEDGHWAVKRRFGRALLGRLPRLPCAPNTHLYPVLPPVFRYVTDTATELLDLETGAQLARFAPGPLTGSHDGSLAFSVLGPDKQPRCRVFDGKTRRVLETPPIPPVKEVFESPAFPPGPHGLACRYLGDGVIAASSGLVGPLYVWSEQRGFLQPSGRYSRTRVPFCRQAYQKWDPTICFEQSEKRMTFVVWDPILGVRSATADGALHVESFLLSPDGSRLAVSVPRQTLLVNFRDGSVTPWGNATFIPRRFSDDGRTLYGDDGPVAPAGVFVYDDLPFAVRDGRELDPALVAQENAARAKAPFGEWSQFTRSPGGTFAAREGSPPLIARVADGRYVRVVVADIGGRPRSLVVDQDGYFAGDPELEHALLYAVGTNLRDAMLETGTQAAPEFRRPEKIREFFAK